jgi:hypothetical protein
LENELPNQEVVLHSGSSSKTEVNVGDGQVDFLALRGDGCQDQKSWKDGTKKEFDMKEDISTI